MPPAPRSSRRDSLKQTEQRGRSASAGKPQTKRPRVRYYSERVVDDENQALDVEMSEDTDSGGLNLHENSPMRMPFQRLQPDSVQYGSDPPPALPYLGNLSTDCSDSSMDNTSENRMQYRNNPQIVITDSDDTASSASYPPVVPPNSDDLQAMPYTVNQQISHHCNCPGACNCPVNLQSAVHQHTSQPREHSEEGKRACMKNNNNQE